MSYCRWSSDGHRCDLYVYADVSGGYTSHVAGRRRLGLDTLPPDPYDPLRMQGSDWVEVYRAYNDALDKLPFQDIDLPHAGESFNDPDPGSCADRLETLRSLGYYVPQYAIDALREEAADPGASR